MNEVESRHRRIATAAALTWEWDSRFSMVLAAFDFDRAPELEAMLATEFAHRWGVHDIANAPQRVRDLAQQLGGMRGGQILFTTSDRDPVMTVGAWWPWGNGKRFSIRIGSDAGRDIVETGRLQGELPSWYGV